MQHILFIYLVIGACLYSFLFSSIANDTARYILVQALHMTKKCYLQTASFYISGNIWKSFSQVYISKWNLWIMECGYLPSRWIMPMALWCGCTIYISPTKYILEDPSLCFLTSIWYYQYFKIFAYLTSEKQNIVCFDFVAIELSMCFSLGTFLLEVSVWG